MRKNDVLYDRKGYISETSSWNEMFLDEIIGRNRFIAQLLGRFFLRFQGMASS